MNNIERRNPQSEDDEIRGLAMRVVREGIPLQSVALRADDDHAALINKVKE